MSANAVEKFYEQMALDPKLRKKVGQIAAKLKSANPAKKLQKEAFSLLEPIAEAAGHHFTFEDIEAYQLRMKKKPAPSARRAGDDYGTCACVLIGGGTLTYQNASGMCYCFGDGGGSLIVGDKHILCVCVVGGGGG